MSEWKQQKRWSDKFLPEIKRILGEYLIAEPPVEDDMERNTDLMVLRLDAVRIACRVRKYEYLKNYGHQFTIRYKTRNGNKTELTKIIEGWGNYFFYGFANETETKLHKWVLGDLSALRLHIGREFFKQKLPWCAECENKDGSVLVAFNVLDVPDFVIADSIDHRLRMTGQQQENIMNRTILTGNLTRDIDLRHIPSGLAVAEFGLAVNDNVKRGDKWEKETSFFDCVAFGHTANALQKYTSKGTSILVEGRLKQETWKDKETGQNRSKVKVIVDSVEFIGGRKETSNDSQQEDEPQF